MGELDFSIFGNSSYDYIISAIKKEQDDVKKPQVGIVEYSVIKRNKRPIIQETGYVIGFSKDDFYRLGFVSNDDLAFLHSLHDSGTIHLIYTEESPDILGFLLSDTLYHSLACDPLLSRLLDAQTLFTLYQLVPDDDIAFSFSKATYRPFYLSDEDPSEVIQASFVSFISFFMFFHQKQTERAKTHNKVYRVQDGYYQFYNHPAQFAICN